LLFHPAGSTPRPSLPPYTPTLTPVPSTSVPQPAAPSVHEVCLSSVVGLRCRCCGFATSLTQVTRRSRSTRLRLYIHPAASWSRGTCDRQQQPHIDPAQSASTRSVHPASFAFKPVLAWSTPRKCPSARLGAVNVEVAVPAKPAQHVGAGSPHIASGGPPSPSFRRVVMLKISTHPIPPICHSAYPHIHLPSPFIAISHRCSEAQRWPGGRAGGAGADPKERRAIMTSAGAGRGGKKATPRAPGFRRARYVTRPAHVACLVAPALWPAARPEPQEAGGKLFGRHVGMAALARNLQSCRSVRDRRAQNGTHSVGRRT
jgi:hypothetical protein